MSEIEPKRGLRFYHAHWLGEDNSPLLHEVTAVRRGSVYYRAVYPNGDGTEARGNAYSIGQEGFPKQVLRVA